MDFSRNRFEVLVVNDGGNDSLESVIDKVRNQLDIVLINQANMGPGEARNNGAAQARGEILLFIDDDCSPDHDWLKILEQYLRKYPDHMVGGRTKNVLVKNLFSEASQNLVSYLYDYYNSSPQKNGFFASNNVAIPAKGFKKIGGFDKEFPLAAGEDRELCDRWLHHGYQMTYAKEAVVYHAHPLTLLSFWRQHFNYGRGAHIYKEIRSRRNHEKVRFEPFSFYGNLLRYPFQHFKFTQAAVVSALLVLSQVANVLGFFWELK